MSSLKAWIGTAVTLGFSLSGQVVMKRAVASELSRAGLTVDQLFRHHLLSLLFSRGILMGAAMSALGAVCWLYVLGNYDLGRALPLAGGMAYIAMFFIGRFVLKESTSVAQLLGIILIVLGVYLLGQGQGASVAS